MIDYKYAIITIIIVFMYMIIPRPEAPERHHHQIVTCQYAMGHKSYSLTFCHTEQAQVGFDDIHRNNLRAERFFEGELNNCN